MKFLLAEADENELRVNGLTRKLDNRIADLERVNASLRASEERFRQLADHLSACFWITNADGLEQLYASPAFEQIWGLPLTAQGSRPAGWIDAIHSDDRARIRATFFARARQNDVEDSYRVVRPDGELRWVRDRGFPIRDASGVVYRIAGIAEDVTEARELTERLDYHVNYDPLTQLANRRLFEKLLEQAIDDARAASSQHALCFIDLDKFRLVNDTCGHIAGDQLLRQLCNVIVRQVGKRDTLSRLGGDEFGLLLEHRSAAQAHAAAESLRAAAVGFRFHWEGTSFDASVSIGVVPIDAGSESVTSVLRAADTACYIAKEKGGNRTHLCRRDDIEFAKSFGEMSWVGRLHAALDEQRFRLYYQNITPTSGAVQGKHIEILLRLLDENGKLVLPGRFLPAAERYSIIGKIDRWVIATALAWLENQPKTVTLCSINVSGDSLADEGFFEFFVTQLQASQVPAEKICIEITETAAITNVARATRFMHVLRRMGCRFALDDFGSGLSSFTYLKHLPVDYLKIDGTFVRQIVEDPTDLAMVKSINDIGHVMGKQTIAEFVESQEILTKLREIGVDYVQGHAVGIPQACRLLAGRSAPMAGSGLRNHAGIA